MPVNHTQHYDVISAADYRKIIFPFFAKSRAHTYTLYAHGHETLQGMGK